MNERHDPGEPVAASGRADPRGLDPGGRLDDLIRELENASARLRAGQMDAVQAAELVERCAELAGFVGAELDRAAREGEGGGQERVL